MVAIQLSIVIFGIVVVSTTYASYDTFCSHSIRLTGSTTDAFEL
jgi:hypothetical protein